MYLDEEFIQLNKDMKSIPEQIYDHLLNSFGPQHWWPMNHLHHQQNGSDPRFEIMIGAILTQNTAWTNVEKAIQNLKKHTMLSPQAIHDADDSLLKKLINPSGFFNQKAKRLQILSHHLLTHYEGELYTFFSQPTSNLRKELLCLHGIGPETADSILLYAGNKPIFVVDAYTKRLCRRLPLPPNPESYDQIQQYFQDHLSREYKPKELVPIYNEYHALIVELGKRFCKKQKPHCPECPLNKQCSYPESS